MPDPDPEFGGYVLERPVGTGGSATVYRAHRLADATPVAVKVLAAEHRNRDELTRLQREFGFARRFDHPHVITVYRQQQHWLAMRMLDGGDISALDGGDLRMIALGQIADALDHIHRGGIVHCDVKPSNILVPKDFSGAVLTDFGVAHSLAEDAGARLARGPGVLSLDPARRITHQQSSRPVAVHASLPYAAPEILLGRMPCPASDQYALACTTVEMLTGAPPFPATTAPELIHAHVHRPPPRLSETFPIPRAVDDALAVALAKQPDRRHPSCTAMIAAVIAGLRGRG